MSHKPSTFHIHDSITTSTVEKNIGRLDLSYYSLDGWRGATGLARLSLRFLRRCGAICLAKKASAQCLRDFRGGIYGHVPLPESRLLQAIRLLDGGHPRAGFDGPVPALPHDSPPGGHARKIRSTAAVASRRLVLDARIGTTVVTPRLLGWNVDWQQPRSCAESIGNLHHQQQ